MGPQDKAYELQAKDEVEEIEFEIYRERMLEERYENEMRYLLGTDYE